MDEGNAPRSLLGLPKIQGLDFCAEVTIPNRNSYCLQGERIEVGKEKALTAISANHLPAGIRRDVMACKVEPPIQIDDDVDEQDFAADHGAA